MRIELRKGNSALTDRNTCSQRTTDRTRCTAERSDSTAECGGRSEEHTSELQSRLHLVCRLLLEKKNILVPAALEDVITEKNASKIKAKLVAEGANGPTTPEADEILFKRNVTLIPDILANSGEVSTSYLEWVQNLQHLYWSAEEVDQRLKSIMKKDRKSVV